MPRLLVANCDSTDVDNLIAAADAHFAGMRSSEALDQYRQALQLQPDNVHALHYAGLASLLSDQVQEATSFLERAWLVAPDRADIGEQCGLLAVMAKDWGLAEKHYRQAIQISGNSATLHRNLADCLYASDRDSEAEHHYVRALDLEPELFHALRALAEICAKRGERSAAANYRLRVWKADSTNLQDGLDLITALVKAAREGEVEEVIRQLSGRFGDDAKALSRLSSVLNQNDRYADGLKLATQGLATAPDSYSLHHNAATALWMCGLPRQCLPYAVEAERLSPANDRTNMKYFLSCVQLSLGDFAQGWKRHTVQYKYEHPSEKLIRPRCREWSGEPLTGCRFLYVLHQGFGDQIQMLRFAEWLSKQGATVDVLVYPQLAGVAASMAGVRAVYSYPDVPVGPYEYWSYMMRIPKHMKLELPMLPVAMPYLAATQEKQERWQAHIDAIAPRRTDVKTRRIGFVWRGSPHTLLDRLRSVRLEALRPLFSLPLITWFSVQKGYAEEDSKPLADEFDVHTLGPMIEDFTDTLAILQTFDLLITVDSSTAHLAGAAGLPVWVLQPAYSEWRWLVDRTDSPWYPSMRLFRQRKLGDWEPVIQEVRAALHAGDAELTVARARSIDSSYPIERIDTVQALAKSNRIARLNEVISEIRARFAGNADGLEVLADVFYKNDCFSDALDIARQGLAIDPTSAPFHHHAALALSTCGKVVEALPHSREAARLWPDNSAMQYQLAAVQLACGQFKEGWARHKAYYALASSKASLLIPLGIPEWNGEKVAGCQLLLVGEQGDGDKFQSIRFAEWLRRQGATVDLLTTKPVAQVAATMKCIRTVYSSESPPGPYDYWTHLLKIPEHMGLDVSMLPAATIPYVFAPPEKVQHWRTHIEACSPGNIHTKRRRIGIVWAGRPTYVFDRFRSVRLDALRPLFALPGTTWFSVQKGQRQRESEMLSNEFDMHTLGPEIGDFADTLAIMETLDLVITVDTSVAHLAGAAGRPVWVLVPAYVEWRWIIDRTDSPWYPSMRLFRQRELGNWEPVIEEVRAALQALPH